MLACARGRSQSWRNLAFCALALCFACPPNASGGIVQPVPLGATEIVNFETDSPVASVGDQIQVQLELRQTLASGESVRFVQYLDSSASYVPGSLSWDGVPIEDTGLPFAIFSDSLVVQLGGLATGDHDLASRLRIRAGIGERVVHRARLDVGPRRLAIAAPTTRIEAEDASWFDFAPDADASIDSDPLSLLHNFGASARLTVGSGVLNEQRGLLRFDDWAPGILGANELIAAHLEAWSAPLASKPSTLHVRRVRSHWNEGSQDGAPCVDGVTWNRPDCVLLWPGGGDLENTIWASAVLNSGSRLLEWRIEGLGERWESGDEPNHGVALVSDLDVGGAASKLVSRDAADVALPAPRLRVVHAPVGAYEQVAVQSALAEINPTQAPAGAARFPFVYSFLLEAGALESGVNRLRIDLPDGFVANAVDSVRVDGQRWDLDLDQNPGASEYEIWAMGGELEIRFGSALRDAVDDLTRVDIHFCAKIPSSSGGAGKEFVSTIDHDRRGHPWQNAKQGNANGINSDSNRWSVTIGPASLVSISLTPDSASMAVGDSLQFLATGHYNDGTDVDLTSQANWLLTAPQLADGVDKGVVRAVAVGVGEVMARHAGINSAPAMVDVRAAELRSVRIDPGELSIAAGDTANFLAFGVYSDASEQDHTSLASWSISDSTVAAPQEPGRFRGLVAGSGLVRAQIDTVVSGPALLDVSPPVLISLAVTPADTAVALGFGASLHATGTYSDGHQADLTAAVDWGSNPPGIVDVGANGQVTTLAEGTTFITASLDDVDSAPAQFVVDPPLLLGLDGSPDFITVPAGASVELHSIGLYSDGSAIDKSQEVEWTSSTPLLAEFVAPALLDTYLPGTVSITHSLGSIVGDTLVVDITGATVDSLLIEPCPTALPAGVELRLRAVAYYSDDTTLDVTRDTSWSSSNQAVADVDVSGLLTTLSEGTTDLGATWNGIPAIACPLLVDNLSLDALSIAPADTTIALGEGVGYRAFGSVGVEVYDFTTSVQWSVADGAVASIDSTGALSSLAEGNTQINANLSAVSAPPASLTVGPARLISLSLTPLQTSVLIERTKALTALGSYSDGSVLDVSAQASWSLGNSGIAYVDPNGVALGLSVGSTAIHADLDGIAASQDIQLQVLPAVTLLALPTGISSSWPGSPDQQLLSLRLSNHYLSPRNLTALRVTFPPLPGSSASSELALYADDGDGIFEPGEDPELARGAPIAEQWTAGNLSLPLGIGEQRTLFATATPSLFHASHGDTLDAHAASGGEFFFEEATALVASGGFPLDSPGFVLVEDLVLEQLLTTPTPADTLAPGAQGVTLLQFAVGRDGDRDDQLSFLQLQQLGDARPGLEIERLRLQQRPAGFQVDAGGLLLRGGTGSWSDVAELASLGGNLYAAASLALPVGTSGRELRVLADVAPGAELGRSVQLALPVDGIQFGSGREGPADAGFSNPDPHWIDVREELRIEAHDVYPPSIVTREDDRLPLLGLRLSSWGSEPDSLVSLRIEARFSHPNGPAPDPDRVLDLVELWRDVDLDGEAGPADELLGSASVSNGELWFRRSEGVDLVLSPGTPVDLLLSADVAAAARDGEVLALALASSGDLQTSLGLPYGTGDPPQFEWSTPLPPAVDGQGLAGYQIVETPSGIVFAGSQDLPLWSLQLPSNGDAADELESLGIEQIGSASSADIAAFELWLDDGDGAFDVDDANLGAFSYLGGIRYQIFGLQVALPSAVGALLHVTVDLQSTVQSSGSIRLRLPLDGVQVLSGNDGPIDSSYSGDANYSLAVGERVTWVAEPSPGGAVPPDVQFRPILVLSEFNGYDQTRTLSGLDLSELATVDQTEIDVWTLHVDVDADGVLDANETPVAIASQIGANISFGGFTVDLPPLSQRRLFVAYSLAGDRARDGSQIDLRVENAAVIHYASAGSSASLGEFPLDSPGFDVVDGHYARQIHSRPLLSRSLGGSEQSVLCLDLELPSNGFESDVLQALSIELGGNNPAVLGEDILALRLYRELDSDPDNASFDPDSDLFLASLLDPGQPLRFSGFAASIPTGGRRFYVSCDMADSLVAGREIEVRLPANGVEMQSGNDGPIDAAISASAVHLLSASPLLLAVDSAPQVISSGQEIDVVLSIENRADSTLTGVATQQLLVPPGATLIQGPLPASVDLASSQVDTIRYRYRLDQVGMPRFRARVASGAVQSALVDGPELQIQQVPSSLQLQLLSNLPPTLYRGASQIIAMSWRVAHPDPLGAAPIEIRSLRVAIEDAAGAPQSAAAALSRLRLYASGQQLVELDPVPALTELDLILNPPLRLQPGELRELPLEIDVAPDAPANSLQLRVVDAAAVQAVDANSQQAVTLLASLPWTSPTSLLRTAAEELSLGLLPTMPATANRGQRNVPAGRFHVDVPAPAGQSDARVLEFALRLWREGMVALDPVEVLTRVRLQRGGLMLLDQIPMPSASGLLELTLDLPAVVSSGAPEDFDVFFDVVPLCTVDSLYVGLPDSTEFVARDLSSGQLLPVILDPDLPAVAVQGPLRFENPPLEPSLTFEDRSTGDVASGAQLLPLARLTLRHDGLPGEGQLRVDGVRMRFLDDRGDPLVASSALQTIRLCGPDGQSLASIAAPSNAMPLDLALDPSLFLAPADSIALDVCVDLRSDPTAQWIRLALGPDAVSVADPNDPTRPVHAQGGVPASTRINQIRAPAEQIAIGIAREVPVNLNTGGAGQSLLRLRVLHPGSSNEADISLDTLSVRFETLSGTPTQVTGIFETSTLDAPAQSFPAQLIGDRLRFAPVGALQLAPGDSLELELRVDVRPAPQLTDFVLRLEAADVVASAGGVPLAVQGHDLQLPYRSPSVHVVGGDLESTLSNYPNPFAAGRQSTHIVFALPAPAKVSAAIYTLDGRLVRRLGEGVSLDAGLQEYAEWDGRNGDGNVVRNGSYILRLEVDGPGGGRFLRKLTVLR